MDSTSSNVLVTGGCRGLGLAISTALLEADYNVIAVSRRLTEEFTSLQERFPGRAHFECFDFSDTKNIHDLCTRVTKDHGRFYGIVNNAALGNDGVLLTQHETDIEVLLKVNVLAPILLTKYMARSLLLQRRGRIVNVSSIIASTGFSGLSVYGATKSALEGFTRSLSRELGKAAITVNCVAPGYMETDMTAGLQGAKLESIRRRAPLGLAKPEDVASAICFLLSDEAARITGTVFTVDGGSTA